MDKQKKSYLLLAYDYRKEVSDYQWGFSKTDLRRQAKELINNGYEIMFAGEVNIVEEFTREFIEA